MTKAKQQDQAALLRQASKRLGFTKRELAAALGISAPTLDAWLAPSSALRHRNMPQRSKLLLAAILADAKRKKK